MNEKDERYQYGRCDSCGSAINNRGYCSKDSIHEIANPPPQPYRPQPGDKVLVVAEFEVASLDGTSARVYVQEDGNNRELLYVPLTAIRLLHAKEMGT